MIEVNVRDENYCYTIDSSMLHFGWDTLEFMALSGLQLGWLSSLVEPFDRLADRNAVKKSTSADSRCWSQTMMDDLKRHVGRPWSNFLSDEWIGSHSKSSMDESVDRQRDKK
jgi:hypothetical protein